MSKRSDPVLDPNPGLDPDPTWITIHNNGTINIFIFYFSGMYACATVPFPVSPSLLLSTPSKISYRILPPEDRRSQPTLHQAYCSFTVSYFTEMFSNVFRNVF